MHLSEKIAALKKKYGDAVPLGGVATRRRLIFWKKFFSYTRAWLWIDEEKDCWSITLASGQQSHSRLFGPALMASIRKDNGELDASCWTGVYKQALTMHPVRDAGEAGRIFKQISEEIENAFLALERAELQES